MDTLLNLETPVIKTNRSRGETSPPLITPRKFFSIFLLAIANSISFCPEKEPLMLTA